MSSTSKDTTPSVPDTGPQRTGPESRPPQSETPREAAFVDDSNASQGDGSAYTYEVYPGGWCSCTIRNPSSSIPAPGTPGLARELSCVETAPLGDLPGMKGLPPDFKSLRIPLPGSITSGKYTVNGKPFPCDPPKHVGGSDSEPENNQGLGNSLSGSWGAGDHPWGAPLAGRLTGADQRESDGGPKTSVPPASHTDSQHSEQRKGNSMKKTQRLTGVTWGAESRLGESAQASGPLNVRPNIKRTFSYIEDPKEDGSFSNRRLFAPTDVTVLFEEPDPLKRTTPESDRPEKDTVGDP